MASWGHSDSAEWGSGDSQWGGNTDSQWGNTDSQWGNGDSDSVRPFRGKEGKWRLFSIDDKKERLKQEKFKEKVKKDIMMFGSERLKEKKRKEEEEKIQDRASMKEIMDQEMKKIEEQNEQERRDAQELESQSLLASARRWH